MSRVTCRLAALAAATALLVLAPAAWAGPTVSAAKGCKVGDQDAYQTTYVTTIRASGTSCRAARKVVRRFHVCRPGKSGRCNRVLGYSCSESREEGIASYDSRTTCRKGAKTVTHTYTQNT